MSATKPNQKVWSQDDDEIEAEFAEVIDAVNDQQTSQKVPSRLDRKIKTMARGSDLDNLEKNWIFSHGARLTLVVLVFFSIAMLWITLE